MVQRLPEGFQRLGILGISLRNGAAKLQAALLQQGYGNEAVGPFRPGQALCLDGMFPPLCIAPGHDIQGRQAAQRQRLSSLRQIAGRQCLDGVFRS